MVNVKELGFVYDIMLSLHSMSDLVKVDLKITRKQALMLSQAIERGLSSGRSDEGDLFEIVQDDSKKELAEITAQITAKAGLTDTCAMLKKAFRVK